MAKLFNVKLSVVGLVEAETAEEAVREFRGQLLSLGLDPYEGDEGDAFESEDLSEEPPAPKKLPGAWPRYPFG